MKKLCSYAAIVVILSIALGVALVAAEEMVLNATAESVTTAVGKNGAPYTRVIVVEKRTVAGHQYEIGTPVMFFGDLQPAGEALAAGDAFKAIVSKRNYQGRTSYTIIKMLP